MNFKLLPDCVKVGPCQLADLLPLLQNLIKFAYYLSTVVVTGFIVYGAFYIMLFGSNSTKLLQGRKIITNAIIGMVLVYSAFIIVSALFWLAGVNCQWNILSGCSPK